MGALDRISVAAIGTTVADLAGETLRGEAAGSKRAVRRPSQRRHPGRLSGRQDRAEAHRHRLGLHPQPLHPRASRRSTSTRRPGASGSGWGGGQTPERDLAQRRLRQTGAAPARGDRGDAADHAAGEQGRADPLHEGDYYDIDIKGWIRPHPAPRGSRCRYTPPPSRADGADGGDVADGLIDLIELRWIDEVVVDAFETGLKRSGSRARGLRLPAMVRCAIDDDEGRAIGYGPPHDLLLRDGQDLHAAREWHGFCRQRRRRRRRLRRGDLAAVPAAISDEMVEDHPRRRPLDKVGLGGGDGRAADGLFLTPPTYFISRGGAQRVPEPDHRRLRPVPLPRLDRLLVALCVAAKRELELEVLDHVRRIPQGSSAPTATSRPARFAGSVLFGVDEPCLGGESRAPTARSPRYRQRQLLVAEGVPFRGERVDMEVAPFDPEAGFRALLFGYSPERNSGSSGFGEG